MKKFLFLLAIIISTGFTACENTSGADDSEAVTCVIAFDANGGSGGQTTPLTAVYGEPMPELAGAPVKGGYSFAGYFDAQTGGTKYYNADLSSAKDWDKTEDITLYAQWIPMPVETNTVTFDANGGSGGQTAPLTAAYGEPMPELAGAPVKGGYSFAGYFDAQTGGTKYYNADLSSAKDWDKTEDIILYAQWRLTRETVETLSSIVSLVRAPSSITNATQFTYESIKALVVEAVALAGGLEGIVKYGDTVVLKPNLINTQTNWGSGAVISQTVNGVCTDYRVV